MDTETECEFCTIPRDHRERIVFENEHAYVIGDRRPITPLHSLIIPKAHKEDWFQLSHHEIYDINSLIGQQRKEVMSIDKTIDGFNIGMNCGVSAGQTIFHCHIHLIPRRTGDIEDPRGGIRHVVPRQGYYNDLS